MGGGGAEGALAESGEGAVGLRAANGHGEVIGGGKGNMEGMDPHDLGRVDFWIFV